MATVNNFNIDDFCSIDKSRQLLCTPYNLDGFAYATDGWIAVRVAAPGIENSENRKTFDPIPKYFLEAKETAKNWITLINLPPIPVCDICKGDTKAPKEETCPECSGDGEVEAETDYNTYEVECKTCNGEGEILGDGVCKKCKGSGEKSGRIGVSMFGAKFDIRYLQKISNLPGLKLGIHGPKLDAHYFIFDGGSGIIMPMRIIPEPEVDSIELTEENFRLVDFTKNGIEGE